MKLTAEREKEIRDRSVRGSVLGPNQTVRDLLAEIDALRADNAILIKNNELFVFEDLTKERDRLREALEEALKLVPICDRVRILEISGQAIQAAKEE